MTFQNKEGESFSGHVFNDSSSKLVEKQAVFPFDPFDIHDEMKQSKDKDNINGRTSLPPRHVSYGESNMNSSRHVSYGESNMNSSRNASYGESTSYGESNMNCVLKCNESYTKQEDQYSNKYSGTTKKKNGGSIKLFSMFKKITKSVKSTKSDKPTEESMMNIDKKNLVSRHVTEPHEYETLAARPPQPTKPSQVTSGIPSLIEAPIISNPEENNSCISYHNYGNARSVMRYEHMVEKPRILQDDEVLVHVEATTVSIVDCMIRNNEWYEQVDIPNVPGTDLIGHIVEISDETSLKFGLKRGNRVAAFSSMLGSNARLLTLFASQLIRIPDGVDAVNAVCLLQSYMTAYQCLYRVGKKLLQFGDKVLVTDCHSDVGFAVIQLAKLKGAVVFASAPEEFHNDLEKAGAIAIGPDSDSWISLVRGGIDIFIQNSSYLSIGSPLAYSALNALGKFIFLGHKSNLTVDSRLSNENGRGPTIRLTSRQKIYGSRLSNQKLPKKLFCYDVFEKAKENPEMYVQDFNILLCLLKEKSISPIISKKIPLHDVIATHEEFENKHAWGCTVCLPWKGFIPKSFESNETSFSEKHRADDVDEAINWKGFLHKSFEANNEPFLSEIQRANDDDESINDVCDRSTDITSDHSNADKTKKSLSNFNDSFSKTETLQKTSNTPPEAIEQITCRRRSRKFNLFPKKHETSSSFNVQIIDPRHDQIEIQLSQKCSSRSKASTSLSKICFFKKKTPNNSSLTAENEVQSKALLIDLDNSESTDSSSQKTENDLNDKIMMKLDEIIDSEENVKHEESSAISSEKNFLEKNEISPSSSSLKNAEATEAPGKRFLFAWNEWNGGFSSTSKA